MKAVVYYLKFVSTYCEMKAVVKSNARLTMEVRNLVIVAYQNGIGSRRRLGELILTFCCIFTSFCDVYCPC